MPHAAAAVVAFIVLAAWPAVGERRGPGLPWGLRAGVSAGASAALFGLLGWFYVELGTGGLQVGLAERVAAGAQALWPLVVGHHVLLEAVLGAEAFSQPCGVTRSPHGGAAADPDI